MGLEYLLDSAKDVVRPVGKPKDGREFLERHRKRFARNKQLHHLLYDAQGNVRQGSEAVWHLIQKHTDTEYVGAVKDYLSKRQLVTDVMRYAGSGLSAIGAGTAAAGLVAFILGGPLGATAAMIGSGLMSLLYGAGASTAADVKEAIDSDAALRGYQSEKVEEKSTLGKVLGYVKKGAKGTWEYVKGVLNPKTYWRNKKQLAEGLAHRAATYGGLYLGHPWAAFGAATDHYRGSLKFRNKVIDSLVDRIAQKVVAEHEGKVPQILEMKPEQERMVPLQYAPSTDWAYQAVEPKAKKKLGYVRPRRMAA